MFIQKIIEDQLAFYRKGNAGCLFAAHVASDPNKFGWYFAVCEVDQGKIDALIQQAISDEKVSTQSIIFPKVLTRDDLKQFLVTLVKIPSIFLANAPGIVYRDHVPM